MKKHMYTTQAQQTQLLEFYFWQNQYANGDNLYILWGKYNIMPMEILLLINYDIENEWDTFF